MRRIPSNLKGKKMKIIGLIILIGIIAIFSFTAGYSLGADNDGETNKKTKIS